MTRMLASVTDPKEVEIALAGGADIIDLKNAAAGAFAAVDDEIIVRGVALVAGRAQSSAGCGDLPMEPDTIVSEATRIASCGVDFVKVGLFPSRQAADCARALAPLAARAKLIAVLFADREPDFQLLDVLAAHGFHGAMVDTADKSAGRLLDHLPPERIAQLVAHCRSVGLEIGLSGSLEAPDVPRLLIFKPDVLGFRGALCTQARRQSTLRPTAVAQIRALIPRQSARDIAPRDDHRLLAANGTSPMPFDAGPGTDKIFVRDFVLPVRIGAYSFEKTRPQKVRFDVTAEVLRATRIPEDMRHIVTYDLIMDAIRAIVAGGHITLAETLAEQVAEAVLSHPRVARVTVRVEKQELGPGGVGVEIERRRIEQTRSSGAAPDNPPGRFGGDGP